MKPPAVIMLYSAIKAQVEAYRVTYKQCSDVFPLDYKVEESVATQQLIISLLKLEKLYSYN